MERKYKTMAANEKCGKHYSVDEAAKEIIASQAALQNEQKTKESYDEDSADGVYIRERQTRRFLENIENNN